MRWYHDVAYFFAGAFLANTLPHLGNGISGHPFQSPFASPPGEGLSSSTVNVLWGLFNLAVGYLLVCRVGSFDLRNTRHVLVLGAGILIMSVMLDHLIPLELGGDSAIGNLWPESAQPVPGFREKDKVENVLHQQVCSGAMRLADAQRQIATDWIAVWRRIQGQVARSDGREDDGD